VSIVVVGDAIVDVGDVIVDVGDVIVDEKIFCQSWTND
jgi:hypothetical protein